MNVAVVDRYVGGVALVLVGVWIAATQPFGYWLRPVSRVLFLLLWELRPPGFGSFLTRITIVWLWFAVYVGSVSVLLGNLLRWAASHRRQ